MTNKVLLIEPTIREIGVSYLKKHHEIIKAPNGEENTIIQFLNDYSIRAVITRVEQVTERIIVESPSLELIGQSGVGVDNIDIEAASKHGVLVANVPDGNYISVAEHALMFILALSRNLLISDSKVRNGEWCFRERFYPMEISGKMLLLIGFGLIAKETASKARAVNMEIMSYDPYVDEKIMLDNGVTKVTDLKKALQESDFVSIHVPYNEATKNLISYEEIGSMKRTAFLINVSRGKVVNQKALFEALSEERIGGAALDVLEEEPPPIDSPLLRLENVIFTPHYGGDTREAKDRCAINIAKEISKGLKGKIPKNLVNARILRNSRLQKHFNSTANN